MGQIISTMVLSTAALIAGGVTSLASAGLGTYFSAKKGKDASGKIDSARDENKELYNSEYNSDYLTRNDIQAILKKQRELLNKQYAKGEANRAQSGVPNTSNEVADAQVQNANDTLSNTMTNIAGQASAHKDAVQQRYQQTDMALAQQQAAALSQQSGNIASAAGQGVSAGLNLMGTAIKKEDN